MAHVEIAKQSARGTFVLFIGNFISTLVAAAASIIIARLLGPSGYGLYTLVLLIPSIFQLFLGIGVNVAVTRYAAYHVSRNELATAKRMTENAIFFLTLVGAILTLCTFLGADYLSSFLLHRTGLTDYVMLASVLVLGQAILQSSTACFMGWNAMGMVSITTVLQSILKLAISPILILVGFGVLGAIVGQVSSVIGAGLVAVILLYLMKLRGTTGGMKAFKRDIVEMVHYGVPVYAGSIVLGFSGQYLTLILAAITTNAVIGNYQAATNMTMAIGVISSAITLTLLPTFASLDGIGADVGMAMKYAVKYVGYVIAPFVFFFIGAARPLVDILYGASFSQSILLLRLLAVSGLPMMLGSGVLPSFFNAVRKTRFSLILQIAFAVSTFITAPLLGVELGLGVEGLIYSQLISNMSFALLGLILSARYLNARVDLKSIGLIAAASLLAVLCVAYLELLNLPPLQSLVLEAAIFLFVYLTAAPIIGAVDEADLIRLAILIENLSILKVVVNPLLAYERKVLSLVH